MVLDQPDTAATKLGKEKGGRVHPRRQSGCDPADWIFAIIPRTLETIFHWPCEPASQLSIFSVFLAGEVDKYEGCETLDLTCG